MQVHFKFLALTIFSGAGLVSAQSLSIPPACSTALKGILVSPDAACLNPSALLTFAIGSSSIPSTVNNWLNGICSTGSCSDAALASVVTNVTAGCSEDLSAVGFNANLNDEVISIVQKVYPTVRKIACLKDDSTSALCLPQTITNVQNAIGNLDFSNFNFLNIIEDVKALLATNLPKLACTDCVKEAYTIALTDFPDIVSEVKPEVEGLCGASFSDGNLPDTISQTAVSGLFSTKQIQSLALSSKSMSGIGSGLLTVTTLFMIWV